MLNVKAVRRREEIERTKGITWVSPKTWDLVLEIKLSSSGDRSAKIYSELQRLEMLRKVDALVIIADREGRTADVRFLEHSIKLISKKKLSKLQSIFFSKNSKTE